jgi:hypothetical protein
VTFPSDRLVAATYPNAFIVKPLLTNDNNTKFPGWAYNWCNSPSHETNLRCEPQNSSESKEFCHNGLQRDVQWIPAVQLFENYKG